MTEDAIHPQQVIAQQRAAEKKEARENAATIIMIAQQQGVRFVEVDPETDIMEVTNKPPKAGRLTVAYVQERNIVMIATAICHPNDKFDKRMGRAFAARALLTGQFIQLRKPTSHKRSTKDWLISTFKQYGE